MLWTSSLSIFNHLIDSANTTGNHEMHEYIWNTGQGLGDCVLCLGSQGGGVLACAPHSGQCWARGHVCGTGGGFLHLCTDSAPAGGGNGPTNLGPSCEVQWIGAGPFSGARVMVPVFPLMLGCTVFGVGTGGSCPCDLWAHRGPGAAARPPAPRPRGAPPTFPPLSQSVWAQPTGSVLGQAASRATGTVDKL